MTNVSRVLGSATRGRREKKNAPSRHRRSRRAEHAGRAQPPWAEEPAVPSCHHHHRAGAPDRRHRDRHRRPDDVVCLAGDRAAPTKEEEGDERAGENEEEEAEEAGSGSKGGSSRIGTGPAGRGTGRAHSCCRSQPRTKGSRIRY